MAEASDGSNTKDNVAWAAMKLAMNGLEGALDVFPPLKAAVGGLIADQNHQEYKQLALDLASLASQLQSHLPQSKPTHMPYSVQNVARAIEDQVRHIQQQQDRSRTREFVAAREDETDVIGCYRRVEALFRQLQTDISLSIWDVVREQQMNTSLKDLLPADDARYNSALSASMTKRRGCTQNTRTQVLTDARAWTRDEGAAKIYWMNGMAGTGKTTIAYSLCKWLEDDKQLGASFFCSRDSPTCRDVNKIVPTLAYQLARYSNPYRQTLCDVLSNDADAAKKDIETQFEDLIAKPIGGVKQALPRDVVVVIDALDECTDITGTKQVLELLFRHAQVLPIKFFVTSRPEPAISDKILSHDDASRSIFRLHDIEQSLVQDDIKIYLTEALAPAQLKPTEIDQLSVRAGSLFIFAATAVRYILPETGSVDPRKRLAILLGLDPNPDQSGKSYRDIDKLYSAILSSAMDKEVLEESEVETRRRVLWTVVCAREPLAISTIAGLLDLMDDQDVRLAVGPLQSVLHISESTGVVSTLHASFPDFLLSKERAGLPLYCDEAKHSEHLATCCFELMKRSLRFNICDLETSYLFDQDVPNIHNRVGAAISPGLSYACRYWGDHLARASPSTGLLQLLDDFLQLRLLFWMEVLNLKGWVNHGENILNQALSWLPVGNEWTDLRQLTYDASYSVASFAGNSISRSTPHIYLSVLPFMSKQSQVWKTYWPRMQGLLRVEGTGVESRGPILLARRDVGSAVKSLAQSSDGKRLVCGTRDGTVSVWDVSTGTRIVGPLQNTGVNSTSFSPDDTRIASGSEDCTIRIWASQNGNLILGPLEGHSGSVLSIAFSPDEHAQFSGWMG